MAQRPPRARVFVTGALSLTAPLIGATLFAATPAAAQCLQGQTVASDAQEGDNYGASIAAWGTRVAVGAEYADSGSFNEGSVYVVERQNGVWAETAVLTHADADEGHRLGHAVSIWGDSVVAGARYHTDQGYGTGAAYVFTRDAQTGAWSQQTKLLHADAAQGDLFGQSVGIHGQRILIGAHGEDSGAFNGGAVYAFEFDGSVWQETQKLIPSDADMDDRFGEELALFDERAIVGARTDDEAAQNAGAAYVFEVDESGAWVEVAKLLAPDAVEFDRFGNAVDIYGDLAVVGAALSGENFEGAAYLFERADDGTWNFLQKLLPPAGVQGANYGLDVSIWGERVAVGMPTKPGEQVFGVGELLLYERTDDGSFSLTGRLASKAPSDGLNFGQGVALFRDLVAVGARGSAVSAGYQSGEVYLYAGMGQVTDLLDACPNGISLSQGGEQRLELYAGLDFAGELYQVLGSLSGTSPGPVVDGWTIPLAVDGYFTETLNPLGPAPLVGALGLLDAAGRASAQVALAPGGDPSLAGLVAHHAFVVFSSANGQILRVSDAVSVQLAN
jgi:hypothetical protein